MGSASLATQPSPAACLPSLPAGGRLRLRLAPPPRAPPRLCKRAGVVLIAVGKLRVVTIRSAHSGVSNVSVETPPDNEASVTGAAYGFRGATTSLTNEMLTSSKKITLVRHGLSTWNAESRVQGSSNLSVLTETGAKQAEKCRDALANMKFDSTAEIIWKGKEEPLIFLDSLKEAHLFFLEGMTNADAKKEYPELYTRWREDPSNFKVNGIYPVRKFRSIDVNNGGMCVFTVNKRGEAMLQALNMTAHMYSDHTYQY
uniref:Uncharacterized protein n=2 Tax=Oryza TaxID=4527 RepID=A0A0E0MTP0_ORYRU